MKNDKHIGLPFILLGMLALCGTLLFGVIGALQFVYPDFLELLPFFKSRPLHVSLAVSWIFLVALGGIYHYFPNCLGIPLYSKKMVQVHWWIFVLTGLAIIASYFMGKFGGREYWKFPMFLVIPIIIGWILFIVNYFKTAWKKEGQWPVFMWMWGTGAAFFLFTFLEANAWIFSPFNDNIVREITVQWKSYGSLVGSWNMLVYGTAFFVMTKISGDDKVALTRLSFLMYILGFINLLFGWAHHTYFVESHPSIRYFAYGISMTELIILAKIIHNWRNTVTTAKKHIHVLPYHLILASEIWVFLNLIVALAISIPAINIFTHGTHITVAHAMGSTIGINSMILLASIFYILREQLGDALHSVKTIKIGIWMSNAALLIFWCLLLAAGSIKSSLNYSGEIFQSIMAKIIPYLTAFAFSGILLLVGLLIVLLPAIKQMFGLLKKG